jgi:Cu(I)/Ag(I) efflux system membrane protein CusA/SilA
MIEKIIEYSARNRFIVILMVSILTLWGTWAIMNTPLDAIPDLSDVQVILFTEWPGRSPDLIESQVTYPIVSALLAAPHVKVVRGFSSFGFSNVYVIFEDGTDMYWARSRVLEYLSKIRGNIPEGVNPVLGPDATSVGWIFQYALVDKTGKRDLSELRTIQDWYLKYALESAKGVAEVASIGGFVKEYQITVEPDRLRAYGITLMEMVDAVRKSNRDTGGRDVEFNGREFMVKGAGYFKGAEDIKKIVLSTNALGSPLLVGDVADVKLGPMMRRGIADLDGEGEAVGGIVVMRYGENALTVIKNIKEKLAEIKSALPEGVEIKTVYDRSDLIYRAIETLRDKLLEESVIVSIICIVFLFHFRSALVAIITLPIAIIMSFITFKYLYLTTNIMSLGGIAIAIGAMVDAGIVMIENAHKHIEHNPLADRTEVIIAAARQVGKPLFFSLIIITVSFIPVFTLEAQEGRLFKPLSFTKTFSMLFAAFLSITLVPALMVIFIKGRIASEGRNPINRFLVFIYRPFVRFAIKLRWLVVLIAIVCVALTVPVFKKLGSEFMPVLDEGTVFYMPTTLPGISAAETTKSLIMQDALIKSVPEVESVFGKMGRAETATDPSSFSMAETVVQLKPRDKWRPGMTWQKIIEELDEKVRIPGWVNAWTMPIKARIDMLSTGIKTPVGIKIYGEKPEELQRIGLELEKTVSRVPGTRSAYAERTDAGYYLDIVPDRGKMARYGVNMEDMNMAIETGVGGMMITTTVEGRERYAVTLRYKRGLRTDLDAIRGVLVPIRGTAENVRGTVFGDAGSGFSGAGSDAGGMGAAGGAGGARGSSYGASGAMGGGASLGQIPLGELAKVSLRSGPDMLRNENGMLSAYVYIDITDQVDVGRYVERARSVVEKEVKMPVGYSLQWSGQYEYMERAKKRLMLVVPLTLALIFILLYLNFRSVVESIIVMLSVPFALIGGFLYIYIQGYNLSVAVWVGVIALAGVAAETGVVMIVYLDEAYHTRLNARRSEGAALTRADLYEAVIEGAVQRVRPKVMTVSAIIAGLVPIMWSHGTGADVMKRIATPMIGGMVTSTLLTLFIIPAVYFIWKGRGLK